MPRTIVAIGLGVVLALSLFGLGCGKSYSSYGSSPTAPSSPAPVPPNTVVMSGMAFSPTTLTVSVGTTVTWKNTDGIAHTSTSSTGVWDTGNIPAGNSKTTTFNTAGTYPYVCTYHEAMGMKGTVIVQ